MIATVAVRVRVAYGTHARLAVHLRAEKARGRQLLTQLLEVAGYRQDLPGAERARLLAEARAVRAAMRARGELLDTVDALVTPAVRAELAGRGWAWPLPTPPRSAPKAGRWPGSRDSGYPEAISLRLPPDLARQVYAGCWHASKEAIAELRAWRDANPGVVAHLDPELRADYDEMAARVITPGHVLRAAVARALPADDTSLQT
ncbi:hypothetical protein [Streptosporangium saharense]|uniref:Uncharacterized protein n=1 Tax=Streptosporangium saharense TaxID=1706840 RepID=A0A7W7QWD8_9ACTN|nr:hypothetical protein [Streptosporangium saharense]MBB4920960.1 hypothetical protein [Streptosporangium saharense]